MPDLNSTTPGFLSQVQGADYRGTSGLKIPSSGGVSDHPIRYDELIAMLAEERNLRSVDLSNIVLAVGNQIQTILYPKFAQTVFVPTTYQEFTHGLQLEPTNFGLWLLDGTGTNITDVVHIKITQPKVAISVETDIPVAYRIVIRP